MFNKNVLIIDDDAEIVQEIIEGLQGEDRAFFVAANIEDALKILREELVDTVILDRLLKTKDKDEDGLEVFKKIQEFPKIYRNPYKIILTGESLSYEEKEEGYRYGAAAYFNKKTEFSLFLLSANKHLENQHIKNEFLFYGAMRLDMKTGVVKNEGLMVETNNSEYLILLEILKRPGVWLTREEIEKICWGKNNNASDGLIPTTICRLKKKFRILEENLLTQRGRGYCLKEID